MSELNKPIPPPFMPKVQVIETEVLESIMQLISKHGYTNFFIAVHKDPKDTIACELIGGASFKSACLLRFLEQVIVSMKNVENDVE